MLVPDPKINAATFFSFFNYKRFTQMSDGWFAAQNLDLEKIKINEEKRRKSSISSKKKFFTRPKMSPTRVVHFTGMKMVPRKNIIYFDI